MIVPMTTIPTVLGKFHLTNKFREAAQGDCYLDYTGELQNLTFCTQRNTETAIFYGGYDEERKEHSFVIRLPKNFHAPTIYIYVVFEGSHGYFKTIRTMLNAKRPLDRKLTEDELKTAVKIAVPYLLVMAEHDFIELD